MTRRFRPATLRQILVVVAAVVLAAAIFVLRLVLDDPNEGVTLLFVVPIAMVAIEFGFVAGLGAALVSIALYAVWEAGSPEVDVGPIGYAVRTIAFCLLGGLLGRFATERKELIEQLRKLSQHDSLTGLFNRYRFEVELDRELARVRRHGGQSALLFFDVDGLKRINDELGHHAGDQVLIMVAHALASQLRPTDVAARLGGDEFVVLLVDTDATGVSNAAQRLLAALGEARVGRNPPASASVGAILFDGNTSLACDELIDAADRAMYSIKRSGGADVAISAAAAA